MRRLDSQPIPVHSRARILRGSDTKQSAKSQLWPREKAARHCQRFPQQRRTVPRFKAETFWGYEWPRNKKKNNKRTDERILIQKMLRSDPHLAAPASCPRANLRGPQQTAVAPTFQGHQPPHWRGQRCGVLPAHPRAAQTLWSGLPSGILLAVGMEEGRQGAHG